MSGQIATELAAGVLTVTIDRPDKKNALTRAMYAGLANALEGARENSAVRVVVLRGTGGVFTAGNDLKDFMHAPPTHDDSPVFRFLLQLVDFDKPLIGAVEGAAIGVGTTMLFHADLVYAATDAKFHFPFVNLGLVPEAASSILLPELIGLQKASELLMLAEPFDAASALTFGLVNEVLDPAELYARARARAETLAQKPTGALCETKRLIRHRTRERVKEALRREGAAFAERLSSPEAMEAFQAFFEKRKPDFSKFA